MLIFLIIGSLTVLLDYVIYQIFLLYYYVDLNLSKGLGFIGGTVFSYFANRSWTFKNKAPIYESLPRFYFLYLLSLGINVIVNAAILNVAEDISAVFQIAFIFATLISASINFLGMKFFVFNKNNLWDN